MVNLESGYFTVDDAYLGGLVEWVERLFALRKAIGSIGSLPICITRRDS